MASKGANLKTAPTPTPEPEKAWDEDAITVDENVKYQLQQEMGQTGYEAGNPNASSHNKIYVATSKAFNINAYLNSDGKTIHSENSSWDSFGYTKADVQNAIQHIDNGMKPLSQAIKVNRFISAGGLGKMLNMNMGAHGFDTLVQKLESGGKFSEDFKTMLQGTNYTHKAYTSTTYTQSHPSFGEREVRLNMVMAKGTSAIVTNNDKEHEILGGRGLKYEFTGGHHVETVTDSWGFKRKQLVIDVIVHN